MSKFHYPDQPIVGIGIIVWQQDKVLLIRRKNPPRQGEWGLPGGKQKLGETLFEAAAREVREEAGIEIKSLEILTALDGITLDKTDCVEFHYTIIEVVADWDSGEIKAADDALDACWASLDEVEKLCGWDEVLRVVRMSMLQRVL